MSKYDPYAHRAERWQEVQANKDLFPYLEYIAVGDELECARCRELDGTRKHVDDPFWEKHFPPWHDGCRCDVQSVRRL